MKSTSVLLFFLFSIQSYSQIPYLDIPGVIARYIEETTAYNYSQKAKQSTKTLAKDIPVMTTEVFSRSTLGSAEISIDVSKYAKVCDCFVNPIAKSKCKKERDYYFKAFNLVKKIYDNSKDVYGDNAAIYQIREQYADVCGDIINGLKSLEIESSKWCFKKN